MHIVQHYLKFIVCYSEEPTKKKSKCTGSEQRKATLLNIHLDNERLVLEKEKLLLEIEVLQENKELIQLKKTLLVNKINSQFQTVYTTEI